MILTANLSCLLLNTARRLPDVLGVIRDDLTRSLGELAERTRAAAVKLAELEIVRGSGATLEHGLTDRNRSAGRALL